jgi:hypothetical protein
MGATRVAIGVVGWIAPERFTRDAMATPDAVLMTRSFAIRETVLGLGGVLATTTARPSSGRVATWAGLGALTDLGDLVAASLGRRRRGRAALVPVGLAGAGLCIELWALARSRSLHRGSSGRTSHNSR